jgi:hypothetical protein
MLAIRKARARSASANARQTSSTGELAGKEAFLAAMEAPSGLRILTPAATGGNNKGPEITGAFDGLPLRSLT